MFVFTIVLFATFLVLLLVKSSMFPNQLFHSLTSDLTELGMLGGACISYLTIVAQVRHDIRNPFFMLRRLGADLDIGWPYGQ